MSNKNEHVTTTASRVEMGGDNGMAMSLTDHLAGSSHSSTLLPPSPRFASSSFLSAPCLVLPLPIPRAQSEQNCGDPHITLISPWVQSDHTLTYAPSPFAKTNLTYGWLTGWLADPLLIHPPTPLPPQKQYAHTPLEKHSFVRCSIIDISVLHLFKTATMSRNDKEKRFKVEWNCILHCSSYRTAIASFCKQATKEEIEGDRETER